MTTVGAKGLNHFKTRRTHPATVINNGKTLISCNALPTQTQSDDIHFTARNTISARGNPVTLTVDPLTTKTERMWHKD